MVEMYISKLPKCPKHGQMKEDLTRDLWMCAGYDGEGCDYTMTMEEWYATFRALGTIDEIHWRFK
jgi:hypothetical protein